MILRVLKILAGFAAAVFAATIAGNALGVPLMDPSGGPGAFPGKALSACLATALFIFPFAASIIAIGESERLRWWVYWALSGALIGIVGFFAFKSTGNPSFAAMDPVKAPFAFLFTGLLSGLAYWLVAGADSGDLSKAFAVSGSGAFDERLERRRCARCTLLGLAMGAIPLILFAWQAFHRTTEPLPARIIAKAEADGQQLLKAAGLPELAFKIDGQSGQEHVGHITGKVTDQGAKTRAFDRAKKALAPLIGLPGVIAVLQNDLTAENAMNEAEEAERARISAAEDATRKSAEEKAKAAEAEAKRAAEEQSKKQAEEARLTAEADAKRKAEDDAKKKANEERLAAEAETKRKAEEARLTAEADAKRKAEEEAKKAEDARLAAVADAKRKAEEDAKKAEEARFAAEADAKRKADEAAKQAEDEKARLARLATEAEANRKWQADARKAAEEEKARLAQLAAEGLRTEQVAVPDSAGMAASKAARAACVAEFGEHMASNDVLFEQNSSALSSEHGSFLDKLANISKRCDGIGIVVQGYADAWGSDLYNQRLSEERAEAVRAALVERGVVSDRLVARGFGEMKRRDLSRNREADRVNRRVDFSVVEIENMPRGPQDPREKSLKE